MFRRIYPPPETDPDASIYTFLKMDFHLFVVDEEGKPMAPVAQPHSDMFQVFGQQRVEP